MLSGIVALAMVSLPDLRWLAHRLSTLHTPADPSLLTGHATGLGMGPNERVFHKVVVVTDQVVLDRQLQDTTFQFDHTPGVVERIDKSSAQLAEALAGSRAQIIITMLQKFPVIAKAATDLAGKRFAVIVDEAHSSQSGESAKDLKAVLGANHHPVGSGETVNDAIWDAAERFDAAIESSADAQAALTDSLAALRASAATRGVQDNLSFFAFTATPKAKTLELFGERIADPAQPSGYRLEPFHLVLDFANKAEDIQDSFRPFYETTWTEPTDRTSCSPSNSASSPQG